MTAVPQEGTSSNRYEILGRLAGGGMADIFLARSTNETGVERYVVLKRVITERSRDPHFATMFLDEARLAAQLQHPNIAQVHDIGKIAGAYFYTMEYVHGEDLRHVQQRLGALRRAFPIPLALYVASHALAGLHHAHTRTTRDGTPLGVVHRDVSPSNVMCSYEGVIKLLDFGVAKATQHTAESQAGTIKGKVSYMSPEQCQGSPVDRRSDVYALGIVLYEMLVNRRLYKRDTDFATMLAVVQEEVPPPSTLRPEISGDLDRIVMMALAKIPDQRWSSAADMIEAIEELAAREGHVMSPTGLGRFMRDLFGDRPEPWLELQHREEHTLAITITGQSLSGLDPLAGAVPIAMSPGQAPGGGVVAESMLMQQLDQAPTIGRPDKASEPSLPPPVFPTPVPRQRELTPSQPSLAAQPMLARLSNPALTTMHVAPPPPIAYPTASADLMNEYRSETGPQIRTSQSQLIVLPWWRSRGFVIAATAIIIAALAVLAIGVFGGSHVATPPDAATIAAIPDDDAGTSATGSGGSGANDMPDAAIATATVDAAVGVATVDAGPHSAGHVRTIAQLVAANELDDALALCEVTPALAMADRVRCGIAACNTKQKSTALGYYKDANSAGQQQIEHACKDKGVILHPRTGTPTPPHNPCDDKRYREENPLKCQ